MPSYVLEQRQDKSTRPYEIIATGSLEDLQARAEALRAGAEPRERNIRIRLLGTGEAGAR